VSRILCLDYGRKKMGIAMTDPLGITAQPFKTVRNDSRQQVLDQILEIIEKYEVSEIVVGLPLTMKGQKGPMALEVEKFVKYLRSRMKTPIVFWDERLSSKQAQRTLHYLDMKPSMNKKKVDRIAAAIMLESYVAFKNNKA